MRGSILALTTLIGINVALPQATFGCEFVAHELHTIDPTEKEIDNEVLQN